LDGFKVGTLALGQAFGRVPQRWTTDSISLAPVIHDHERVNDAHAHEAACVLLMLDGDYRETAALRSFRYERFTAVYHPPGMDHQDVIGALGVRLLVFEFRPDLLEGADTNRSKVRSLRDVTGSRAAWDLLKLYRIAPNSDPLDFEARALQLIAAMAPLARATPRDLPSAQRAREYLHANFRRPVTMADLARVASTHPVYLGQMFHRHFGETVGDYVKRLRVRAAAEQLSNSDLPLAEIAFEHGFCDQSHFHRVFKKFAGVTPAEFRREFS
jgi:AraC family transcriptional regulator